MYNLEKETITLEKPETSKKEGVDGVNEEIL
jgi:hypothetical protein